MLREQSIAECAATAGAAVRIQRTVPAQPSVLFYPAIF